MLKKPFYTLGLGAILGAGFCYGEVEFPGEAPGKAQVECDGASATLSNDMFSASFRKAGSGVVFGGMKLADGTSVAASGTNLFTIHLADGKSYTSKELTCSELAEGKPEVDKKHPQIAQRVPGKEVSCTFNTPDKKLEIQWKAVLRNGSHYLRQELTVKALKNTEFASLTPLEYKIEAGGEPTLSGNTTHGKVVINDLVFCGLETPMSKMSVPGGDGGAEAASWDPKNWNADLFEPVFNVPDSFTSAYGNAYAEKDGPMVVGLKTSQGLVNLSKGGSCKLKFSGALNVVGVQLLGEDGSKLIAEDVHQVAPKKTVYKLEVPEAGLYTLRIWVDTKNGEPEGSGRIACSLPMTSGAGKADTSSKASSVVLGEWERRTTLKKGQSWNV